METVLARCIRRTASVVNKGATRTEPLQWLGETSYETGLRSGTTHIKVSTPTDPQADALPLARSLQVSAFQLGHRVDRPAPLRGAGLRVVAEERGAAVSEQSRRWPHDHASGLAGGFSNASRTILRTMADSERSCAWESEMTAARSLGERLTEIRSGSCFTPQNYRTVRNGTHRSHGDRRPLTSVRP